MNRRASGGASSANTLSGGVDPLGERGIASCQPEAAQSGRCVAPVICIALALAVWGVFGQTLRHDFVNLDDTLYASENPHVLTGLTWKNVGWAFSNLEAGFWQPLVWLSLMLDGEFHGAAAGGYHLTSVLLHMANTILLFLVLRRMTGAPWRSAIVAALFALHPLHVESVAWMSQRKDVLSTLFWMLALMCYVPFARRQSMTVPRGVFSFLRAPMYWLALLLFACGLMSKTMVVTLPVVMLLLDYWPLGRVREGEWRTALPRLALEKAPFLLLALICGLLTVLAQKQVGALPDTTTYPLVLRVQNALVSGATYLAQTVWPAKLAVFYPYPKSFAPGVVLAAWVALLAISVVALWKIRRWPYLAVGWLWYAVTLAPVSGLIQVGDHSRADRYTYVPLIGIFVAAVWGFAEWWGARHPRRILPGSAAAAAIAAFATVAHFQAAHWKDGVSLWRHALASAPESRFAHNCMGSAFAAMKRWSEAMRHYERALQLDPDNAEVHYNFGVALAATGNPQEAMRHYERALELKADHPQVHNNLGSTLAATGKWDDALAHYRRAIKLRPDYAAAHNNLATALATLGNFPEAARHFERALALRPDYSGAQYNFALALARHGNLSEAIARFERVLQSEPDNADAHDNLGSALAASGRNDDAIRHHERALQLRPGHAASHNHLGAALAGQRRWSEAIAHYERALQLNPHYAEAHCNLGLALAAQGKTQEANARFQRALELATAQNNAALAGVIRDRIQALQSSPPAPPQRP